MTSPSNAGSSVGKSGRGAVSEPPNRAISPVSEPLTNVVCALATTVQHNTIDITIRGRIDTLHAGAASSR
jgi:hypothetical protein